MRKLVLVLTAVFVLVVANSAIVMRERQLVGGTRILLALAPVDPRSLMQGDYMALSYALEREIASQTDDGRLIVAADRRGIAQLVRIDGGQPLAPGEVPVDYRRRDSRIRIGTNAWFFPEGQESRYQAAKFGEFRADGSGAVLLTGLLDEHLVKLNGPEVR